MNPILKAAQFARDAHAEQRRKYNGRPYIEHPARVAGRVATRSDATEAMVIAAWLHDVVEDTPVELAELTDRFGPEVARLVGELTNPSEGSREPRPARKAQDRAHLTTVSREAKVIKLLDRTDNLNEIAGAPEKYLRVCLDESRLLAEAIGDADPDLKEELLDTIAHCERDLQVNKR